MPSAGDAPRSRRASTPQMSLVPSAGDMQHCPSPTPADAIGVPLHIRVRDTSLAHDEGWPFPHTLYHIVTTQQGQQFEVKRRFREFVVLHQRLRAHLDELPAQFPLWGNVLNRFSPGVLEARKVGLQRYLEDVCTRLEGEVFPQPLRTFLELPAHEEATPEQPMMMQAVLEPTDTVILVAYGLPLDISPKPGGGGGYDIKWNVDAVLNRASLKLPTRVLWVGCVSLRVPKEDQEALADELLEHFDCVPVFLEEQASDPSPSPLTLTLTQP